MVSNYLALTLEQMVAVSQDWLDANKSLLLSAPYTACHMSDLESVHSELLHVLPKGAAVTSEIQALMERATTLDLRHDRLTRGCGRIFEAQVQFAEIEEEQALLVKIAVHYLPKGDGGTILSYQEEAGAALILAEKLKSEESPNPEYRERLKRIPVSADRSLLDKLLELSEVGRDLGEADAEKTKAIKAHEDSTHQAAGESTRKRQFDWIDTAKAIVDGIDRSSKKGIFNKEQQDALLLQLRKADEMAQKRLAQKKERASKEKAAYYEPPKSEDENITG